MKKARLYAPLLLLVIAFAHSAFAQKGALRIDYSVSLKDTASQQFHVTTEIRNINQPRLDLSLPTWDPGW
jgi:Asp-tRNA(Asn)/Glu-tRNA(Gln) amidotransferase B subunit